ncbi:hypothetical protein ABZP36_022625 [Zizania latifolia]
MSVFMCFWLYLGLQKRKLIRAKQKFFQQNGGVLLQQQMRSYGSTGGGAMEDKWIEKTYRDRVDFNRTEDFAVPVVLD